MTASPSRLRRTATRALPPAVLGVALVTGLGGLLQASAPMDATAHDAPGSGATTSESTLAPETAIEAPASVTKPVTANGGQVRLVGATSPTDIPAPALSAYQRAASVINASDRSCHLDWELLGAIGRIESDHGRHGGGGLSSDGVATPPIIGVALDGRRSAKILDTDAGQLDGDPVHDRAVGPMQFIPATWALVGVDADGDGLRDPQDIDDAALAAAVYLCSGPDDLSSDAGRRSAVYRYNHSQPYVTAVLGLMQKYVDGYYSAAPQTTNLSAAMSTALVARPHIVSVRHRAGVLEHAVRIKRTAKAGVSASADHATRPVPTTPTDPTALSEPSSSAKPSTPAKPAETVDAAAEVPAPATPEKNTPDAGTAPSQETPPTSPPDTSGTVDPTDPALPGCPVDDEATQDEATQDEAGFETTPDDDASEVDGESDDEVDPCSPTETPEQPDAVAPDAPKARPAS